MLKKHKIHEIGSGMKLLFTFLSLKVFRHEERETQSFYAALNPTNARRP